MANVGVNVAQHVQHILSRRFHGAQVEADRFNGAERISGHIVWEGFNDLDQVDRQRQIYQVLRQELGPEATQISIILAYSPEEWAAMHEDE